MVLLICTSRKICKLYVVRKIVIYKSVDFKGIITFFLSESRYHSY